MIIDFVVFGGLLAVGVGVSLTVFTALGTLYRPIGLAPPALMSGFIFGFIVSFCALFS